MRKKLTLVSSKFNFLSNLNRQWRSFHDSSSRPLRTLLPSSNSSQIVSPWRSPMSTPSLNPSPSTSQNPIMKSTPADCICNRFFASSGAHHSGIDSDELIEVVELIKRDEDSMESDLNQKSLNLAHSLVAKILQALSDSSVPALRFFNWVLSSSSGFKPNPEIYNLVVDNLGHVNDFKTMLLILKELALRKHCLTEKSFAFIAFSSYSGLKDSVRRVTETLNEVGGSCRGSGIYSLIKVLCGMNSFDLAIYVMEETGRSTSYYNVLIAAKCCKGDFWDARNMLDEMRRSGCEPNMNSYNYLLGSLFKHKRVVEACDLMETMEGLGYFPDSVTFEVVAVHACMTNITDFSKEFLNRMLSEGITPRLTMHAAFIKGYFQSGRVDDAYKYVIEMCMRDKGSANMNYSLLVKLFLASRRVVEAGGILHEMMEKGLKPNFPVYVKVMKDLHKMSRGDLSSQLKSMFLKFSPSKEAG